jgi:hypothetical protein
VDFQEHIISTANICYIYSMIRYKYCAQYLEDHFHVSIIDNKDYFEFTPSVLRTIVEPHHIQL